MRFRFLSFILICIVTISGSSAYSLEVTRLKFNTKEIGRYQKLQIDFALDQEFRNPYNPEEIQIEAVFTAPSGTIHRYPAFYIIDHQMRLITVQGEKAGRGKITVDLRKYEPQGDGYWQIRFAPDEEGLWRLLIEIKAGNKVTVYPAESLLSFDCLPSGEPGFLNPDPQNNHYLRFDDGSFFFGIGFNAVNTMGACMDGEVRSMEVMQKMRAQGGNMLQIDLCQGDYLEWTAEKRPLHPYYQAYQNLGWYNQQVASQIDRAVTLAESLGVYLRFSFFHWADFGENPADGAPGFSANPYWSRNGGPCRQADQFFTDKTAWEYQKKLFRYILARWGYSTHIICWELWNEVDNTLNYNVRIAGNWHKKTSDFLKSYDDNHIVTTSTASVYNALQLFSSFNSEIVTFHNYVSFEEEMPFNIVDNLQRNYKIMRPLNKPIIPGEFGYESQAGLGVLFQLATDSLGIDLHNQMWASLMMGFAATAMPWGWGSYIDRYNLYHHCTGIAKFTEGEDLGRMQSFAEDNLSLQCGERYLKYPAIDFPTPSEKRNGRRSWGYYEKRSVPEVRVLGLISPDKALVWVQDQGSAWVNYEPLEQVEGVVLTVYGLDEGTVKIEYWNTFRGVIINTAAGEVRGGKLQLPLPAFKHDLAVKIYLLPEN